MKKSILSILSVVLLSFALGSCSDDKNPVMPSRKCFAGDFTLTQTKLTDSPEQHLIFLTFDAKNNSSQNFNIGDGSSKQIQARIKVTTTDGSVYETNTILTVSELAAGSTASTENTADYGAGKTYKSYTITLYCE